MSSTLQLRGNPAEAPASVPGAVHENEPCHGASIPTSNARRTSSPRSSRRSTRTDRSTSTRSSASRASRRPRLGRASSSRARPARARSSPTRSGSSSVRAAIEAVGDRATVVAGTGTYSTRHSVASHGARARARRRRVPRRHAVLQQAAAARDRRPLRGDRRARATSRSSSTTSRAASSSTSSRRRSHGSPRSTTFRAVKQANDDLDAGAAHRRARGSTSTQATTPRPAVPRARRRRRRSASTRTSSGRRSPSRCVPCRAGDVERRARARPGARARLRAPRSSTNPIPIKAALNLLGHEVGGHRLPLVGADRGGGRGRPRLPRARWACWSRPLSRLPCERAH